GRRMPTRSPFPTPAATSRAAKARLRSSNSPQVTPSSSVTTAPTAESDRRRPASSAATGGASSRIEDGLERRAVELAARQERDRVVREEQEAARNLLGGETLGEDAAQIVDVHRRTG